MFPGRQNSKKLSGAAAGVSGGKTSFNRFSPFVKTGGENYILGKLNANVQESDVIQVVVRISGFSVLHYYDLLDVFELNDQKTQVVLNVSLT